MIAKIMPGITRSKSPMPMMMPVSNWTPIKEGSLDKAYLKLSCRLTVPFSNWSEMHLIAIPPVIEPTIREMITCKMTTMTKVEMNSTNQFQNAVRSAVTDGTAGKGKAIWTAVDAIPMIAPPIRKGVIRSRNLLLYKLNVIEIISPMKSSRVGFSGFFIP